MPAERFDIEDFEQGSTFKLDVTVHDPAKADGIADLTGYTARSMARKNYADALPAWEFDVSIPDPLAGVIVVELTAGETSAIAKGKYFYDLEVESNTGVVTKIIKGYIIITPEATK